MIKTNIITKTLLIGAMLVSQTAWAQKTKVTSAELLLSRGEAESVLEAKQYIDAASASETTKNWYRTWLVRSMVYTRVVEFRNNELLKDISGGAGYQSAYAMMQFYKSTEKKRSDDEETAMYETRNAFGVAFNEAEDVIALKYYDSGIHYYQLMLFLHSKMDTADVHDLETKAGISHKYLIERLATIATYCTNPVLKTEVLNELIDQGSTIPVVYESLSRMYLEKGDTALAEKIARKGLAAAPGDNAMFQVLVNYFVAINRVDLLFDDVNRQIANNPTSRLYYTRGYLFERRDSFDRAVKDYRKAVEMDEFNYDAQYNLGVALIKYLSPALYSKKASATSAQRVEIDKQLKSLFQEAKDHLEMAAENKSYSVDDQVNIYKGLKTTAMELDDKEGAAYYQSKIDALEASR